MDVLANLESQIFGKLLKELSRSGNSLDEILKAWKKEITTNYSCSNYPQNKYCHAAAVLKLRSVCSVWSELLFTCISGNV